VTGHSGGAYDRKVKGRKIRGGYRTGIKVARERPNALTNSAQLGLSRVDIRRGQPTHEKGRGSSRENVNIFHHGWGAKTIKDSEISFANGEKKNSSIGRRRRVTAVAGKKHHGEPKENADGVKGTKK